MAHTAGTAVCKRPRPAEIHARHMPPCRPHNGRHLFSDVTRQLVAAPLDLAKHDACSRLQRPQGTVPTTIHARIDRVGGTAAGEDAALPSSSRPRPLFGRLCLCLVLPSAVSPSEWSPACATTATQTHGHRTFRQAQRSTGLAGQAGRRSSCLPVYVR